ncbi:MAG: exo-alpha-sialidase [Saprospiraceae bacterium]|nr:exo-alpha-sialidase [Saprospiraceae bacterium]
MHKLFLLLIYVCLNSAKLDSQTTVFKNGDDGFLCYRIPAIVKAPNGELLAFCEARKHNCGDHGDVRIVLKRSNDNGKTWGSLQIVAENDSFQAGNPAPVYDLWDKKYKNGRLFLFYNTGTNASEQDVREGKAIREVWYKTSVDNGKIWSSPVNITPSVSRPNKPSVKPQYRFKEDWRSYANTPGHALQLTRGKHKGRLFIAANHSEGAPKAQFKDYAAHGFYSDNHGKTWQLAPSVNFPSSNESTAAELANGGILLNIRNQSGESKFRLMAFSQSAGAKWDTVYLEKQLPDPVCEGSMVNFKTKTGQNVLLFSNLNHSTKRENLTLYASVDEGKTWRIKKVICEGSSAYSDLVIQNDNRIGVLYEKDNYTKIVYQNFYDDFTFNQPLPNQDYFTLRNGLKNSFDAINNDKKATVAFLGGSITHNKGWRDKTCVYLKEMFPKTHFRFIAAGIPSLGSLPHAFRLQQDLLDSGKIDLLFVEAAVNDRANGTDSLTQIRALEGIVRHAKKANPNMDIVLMSFADPDKTQDYDDHKEPIEVKNHELIAAHYQLPSINLAKEIRDRMQNKEFSWRDDFNDLHPSVFGQELYFSTIKSLLNACFNASTTAIRTSNPEPLNKSSFVTGKYYAFDNAQYDTHWSLDNNWQPTDGLPTRQGFVHVPVLVSTTPESTLSLPFEGTAVGISIVSGADAGMISYSIDGAPYKNLDLYTRWSGQLHLPWYLVLGAGLTPDKHVLTLKISVEKNPKSKGNACRIVHFLVN